MIRLSDLLGHDALALASANKVGTVTGVAIEKDRIVAVGVSGSVIDGSAVRAFDGDVLTFDDQVSNLVKGGPSVGDPRGMKVLDTHGDAVGTVADMTVSTDGTINAIEVSSGEVVLGSRLVAIGSYAVIITAEKPA